ncbi:MAG: hypothetical protein CUR32_02660 [Flavobacterium sp.]|nr:MAG: hypothetical protein CUR32_02660 [Flavobacterium sp.] [Flavobacterium sp. FEMGT703F]
MHNKNIVIWIFVALFTIVSCKKEIQVEELIIKTKKEYSQLEKAKWFLGHWENVSNEFIAKEIWMQETDSSYKAESFITAAKDTVFYEKVDLIERNDSLFYVVSVRDQNKEKPVSFYLTKSTNNQMVFENPKHDFPNKIIYNKINSDSIVASIHGSNKTEIFPMKRKK